jgi:hypothetical protein
VTDAGAADAWEAFITEVEPHVSPEWTRNAREHGSQGWIRLIALVDVHHNLTSPQIVEKIAMTMGDLAGDREAEVAGWTALMEQARDNRHALLDRVIEVAPTVLSEDLVVLFTRSLTPAPAI